MSRNQAAKQFGVAIGNHPDPRRISHDDSGDEGTTMKILCLCLCLSFGLMSLVTAPALAFGGCGVGCHTSGSGACVRDGWEQGLPVRNECPATSRPTPPCGQYYRWSRVAQACVRQW